uniref:Small ribosomal subunit protein mS29 n=1 Tax=Lynceus sp. MCZ IZ 141354 TaxID=1930659 RepID=A0A9N6ZH55_9CRUS|nr:EOG090X05V1 [Lynceus sp. MCZ IZ 141354]
MIRKPALELIFYLNRFNPEAPAVRYVLHGRKGSGKSSIMAHMLHYGYTQKWMLVHAPWIPQWHRQYKEVVPSTFKTGYYDTPYESVVLLKHFASQNGALMKDLQLKTSKDYIWTKREITPAGSSLEDIIKQGLNRPKFSTDCYVVLLKEVKMHANEGRCKVLVVADGINSSFAPKSRARAEDRSIVPAFKFSLNKAMIDITDCDWKNGAVIASVDTRASEEENPTSDLPRYLLGKTGFEHFDPFVPIEVPLYNEKEANSCLDYYINRKWISNPKDQTDQARLELLHISGGNPGYLARLASIL